MGFFGDRFKSKDSKEKEDNAGKELAIIVLSYCEDKVINKFIVPPLNEKDFKRFKFGIAVVNIIMATWVLNIFIKDHKLVKDIIDSMHFNYNRMFDEIFTGDIHVGDIIVDKKEFIYLQKDWGIEGVSQRTGTSYGTLLQTIYPYRQAHYIEALEEELDIIIKGPEVYPNKILMLRVARKLCYHVAGNEEMPCSISVAFLLISIFMQLTDYCKKICH